jgi:hypothetical protein
MWVKKLNVGPWFLIDSFTGVEPKYRGKPTDNVATKDFDRSVAEYRASGYELAFLARVPTGGRVGYMDTTRDLQGMVEFIELGGAFDEVFGRFYNATVGWDGRNPVRPFA